MHHIRHYILTALALTKWARFRDMKPPRVDSNAYSYHLKALQREGYIEKLPEGYRLTPVGLFFVDRMSKDLLDIRYQPKIISSVIVYDEAGNVLLLKRKKQPFIDAWTLPSGKLHIEDKTIAAAARREIKERIAVDACDSLMHIADAYIHAYINGQIVSSVLTHVFTLHLKRADVTRPDVLWSDSHMRISLHMAPATNELIELAKTAAQPAFREYVIDW